MATEHTNALKAMLGEYDILEGSLPLEERDTQARPHNPRRLGTGGCASSPQDYKQSYMYGSSIEQDLIENEDAFFNSRRPNLVIKSEGAVHRLVCYLKAQALSNKEIAKRVNKSEAWISQIIRQPWAQERIIHEIRDAGRDSLQGILASQAEDSVWTLVEIRDNPDAKNADRAQCANSLLDRLLGRPNQPITHSGKVDPTTISDEDLAKVIAQNGQGPT